MTLCILASSLHSLDIPDSTANQGEIFLKGAKTENNKFEVTIVYATKVLDQIHFILMKVEFDSENCF